MDFSRYAVIGHPLGHSMSPFSPRRLFALQGQEEDYGSVDIAPADLSQKLPALLAETRGLNVTIPHKQAVIPFLTRLEGRAALYRSVNTIAVTPEGAVGHNTDADGFLCALKAAGVPLKGRAALLGCGGVGRTFACEAALAGCSIINAVREADQEAAAALKDYVLTLAPGTDYTIVSLDMLAGQGEIDLLINATPVGMYPHADAAPVDQAAVERCAAVFDAVYNPRRTRLLEMAAAAGAKTVAGMPMLVWQAAVAHTIWYGAAFRERDIQALVADTQDEMERLFQ